MSEEDQRPLAERMGLGGYGTSGDTSNEDETKADEPVKNPSANPASDGTDTYRSELEDEQDRLSERLDEDVKLVDEVPETEEVDQDFVFVQTADDRRNIPGTSQYLDQVQRREAEIIRAKVEDREPDLENPPAIQGTPLITEAQAKQQGLDVSGEAVEVVTLPVVQVVTDEIDEAGVNYDAVNGPGGSVAANQGVPV